MSGVFGWSLPPGCSTLPNEEYHPCEDCELITEIKTQFGTKMVCPAGNFGTDKNPCNPNFDRCPIHSFIATCNNCKKRIEEFIADIPKEHSTFCYDVEYCCSKKCAEELKKKFDKEIMDDKMYEEPGV